MNGDHRIIDGYHSAYIQAEFKDGFYNGKYEEHEYNKLKCEGVYKEGRKNGTFKMYDDEGRMKEEKFYKEGKQDGKELSYDFDGTLRRDHTYKDGRQVGKQFTFCPSCRRCVKGRRSYLLRFQQE